MNLERMKEEFLEFVRIDSVSGEERKFADTLIKKMSLLGLEVVEDDTGSKINRGTGNLIARLPARGRPEKPLLLCAHMDTVEPGRGIKPVVDNGIIKSGGDTILGADNKAGVAIIMEALRTLIEEKIPHNGIEIVLTVFEEGGLLGSRHLEYTALKSRAGYVLDSEDKPGTIITSAPTQDRISITVKGKSAHAGINPEKGVNAIEVAAIAIAGMKLGRVDDETTANIGVIRGGKATNIIPDAVYFQGETRSRNRAKKEMVTKALVEQVKKTAAEYNASADIKIEHLYSEFCLDENSPVIEAAAAAAVRSGLDPVLGCTGGGSDANNFNENGIPTVILGIAMKNVHSTDEYIMLEDMRDCCRFIVELVKVYGEY